MKWKFSNIGEEKYNCPHGFDRACHGCGYASDPDMFDPCCLFPYTVKTFPHRKQTEKQTEPGD